MTTTYEGFCSCLDSGDPSPDCGIGRHREEAIRRRRPVTTTDPATDTTTQLAEALVMSRNRQMDAAALLPVVDRAVTRALLPIREAHDWQCDCDPDDPCRVRTALTAALSAQDTPT